jgi:hypothetical protein
MSNIPRMANKAITNIATTLAMFARDFLKRFDVVAQNTVIEKVLSHDILHGMIPSYLHNIKRLKQNHQLFENFHYGLIGHVTSQRAFKLVLVKDIVCTFTSVTHW